MRLKNKVAIITGAGAGIGKACAEVFAGEGAKVVIAARRAENGQPAADAIKASGGEAIFIRCDVAREKDVAAAVAETVEKYGGLDVMVNNAAIVRKARVDKMSSEMWHTMMTNNLTSIFYGCREAAKVMLEQKRGGSIINISSIHARISYPGGSAYAAAKGGMEAFSKTFALEMGPFGIRVNCLEPGATYTELTRPQYTPEIKAALYERVPLKKIAEAEWIAKGALFLASDDACYMTGETLVLDGGYISNGKLAGVTYPDE
jgi:NAD(P)-dependent dehydrogenase (short-subunit alcohol dehydrogenase family)